MARFVKAFNATSGAALVTAVNTFLATLTNPTIHNLDIVVNDQARRIGLEYTALLSYEDGGAALATPFLLRIDECQSQAALETAVQAFLTANPTYFVTSTGLAVLDNEANSLMKKWIGMTLYNTTAGASANFVPL